MRERNSLWMSKSILWLLLFAIVGTSGLALNLTYGTVVRETYDPGLQKLVIAGDESYPPYEYVDRNGVFKGFNVDIVTAIAIQTGMDIEFKPMKWNEALRALQAGDVDAVSGMTVSNLRNKQFVFTSPTLTNQEYIFVRTEENYIHELEDITHPTSVALQKGDISTEALSRNKNLMPLYFDNQEEAIKALVSGKASLYIGNRLTGLYYTQKMGYESQIKIVGQPVIESHYAIAFRKDIHSENVRRFNRALDELNRNGTYSKIHWKWFGETTVNKLANTKRQMTALVAVLLTVLVILAGYVILNRALKLEVSRRTEEIEQSKRLLEVSEKFKSGIIEGISSGVICFDHLGKVILSNQMAQNLLSLDQIREMHWNDFEKRFGFRRFDEIFEKNLERRTLEVDIEGLGERVLTYTLSALPGDDFLLIFTDRTQEKQLMDLINQDDKMKTVGMLASSIAHEIRTPLTVIKATVSLIRMKGGFNAYASDKMTMVDLETDRLNNLLTQLLDYNRPKAIVKEIFPLDAAVADVLLLFTAKFREKDIHFKSKVEAAFVYACINNFKQIIINLIMNAIDAVEHGGSIEISSAVGNGYAVIYVTDDGIGISEDAKKRIFEPFYTGKSSGSGLGLSICKQLVEENEGEMEIESLLGEGTTVILRLPTSRFDNLD